MMNIAAVQQLQSLRYLRGRARSVILQGSYGRPGDRFDAESLLWRGPGLLLPTRRKLLVPVENVS